jgi:hypothetical protein
MKIELICDLPNEWRNAEEEFGKENVKLVIPSNYTEEEYDKLLEENYDEELKKGIRISVEFKKFFNSFVTMLPGIAENKEDWAKFDK